MTPRKKFVEAMRCIRRHEAAVKSDEGYELDGDIHESCEAFSEQVGKLLKHNEMVARLYLADILKEVFDETK